MADQHDEFRAEQQAQTIDITPTWQGLLDTLLALYTNAGDEGRAKAYVELRKMAKAADLYNS